ncbi:uncharacterized protein CIMG_11001 [Coccidioides immitis RS]|uniref:Uncharacterized protein n=1 Tax=Coccidioides immitis (strain RS) TaxID=246410 RepID=A0A0D8JUM8_COCIM|nr:uncharacterized protein CIMG_11001 [Coccidioides immitis RS]KJF59973.1 hypothetical protein CIMG_11001 [Coccidioides immitis RS]
MQARNNLGMVLKRVPRVAEASILPICSGCGMFVRSFNYSPIRLCFEFVWNKLNFTEDFVPLASITINIIFWLDQTAKDEGPEPPCEECDSVPAAALAFLWNHGEVWKWSALGDDQERALSLKHRSIGPP